MGEDQQESLSNTVRRIVREDNLEHDSLRTTREETIWERVARLDERTRKIEERVGNGIAGSFIHRSEFIPVRAVVYGLVALILTGVVGALIGLVLKNAR